MGQLDSPLTPKGIEQINSVGELLRKRLKQNDNILFLSSDLDRAINSTNIIIKSLTNFCCNVLYSSKLREVNLGEMSGLIEQDIKKLYPKFKKDMYLVLPGGESFIQMQLRVESFILKQIDMNKNNTLVIVSHAGPIRAIKAHFSKKTLKEMYNVQIKRCLYQIGIRDK